MNYIDLGILFFFTISFVFGMYYGLSVSLMNLSSFFLSWFMAMLFHSKAVVFVLKKYPDLINIIAYYSEGSSKIPFLDNKIDVSTLDASKIQELIDISGLPNPFCKNLIFNLENLNLPGIKTVGEYFDITVSNVILNLAVLIALFIVFQIIFSIIISIVKNTVELPILRGFDSLAGGSLGVLRGLLYLFIIFSFVPLLYLAVPADFLSNLIDNSKFIKFFLDKNFLFFFIKGHIS